MNPFDELVDVVRALRDTIEGLEAVLLQRESDRESARSALVSAKQRRLNAIAPKTKFVGGKKISSPAPSKAEVDALEAAIEQRRSELTVRKEAVESARITLSQAKDELAEMQRTWPDELGAFPPTG